jgi:hypothetical protein
VSDNSNDKSLYGKFPGNGLSNLYLYGTIHMICGNDYFLSENKESISLPDKFSFSKLIYQDPNELVFMQKL